MGINVLNNTSSGEVRLTAGNTVASGDLVVNAESGYAYPASSALTIAQNNNTTAGMSAISALTTATTTGFRGSGITQNVASSMVQLSNGTIVNIYSGDGSASTTTNLNITFRNLQGGYILAPIVISTTANAYRVRTIGSTGFVVAWVNSTTLYFAIYDNSGNVIQSATSVATITAAYPNYWDVNVNTNGDIVLAYSKTAAAGVFFTRYNSSGVIQGSEVTVEATTATFPIRVLPQSNGGFFVYFCKTPAWKFGRYNSSGVLQGSLVTVMSAAGLAYGCWDNLATELPNGNVVFLGAGSSSWPYYAVYNSSGTVVKSSTAIGNASTAYNQQNIVPGVCVFGSGFVLLTAGTSGSNTFGYDSSGNSLYANVASAFTGATAQSTQNWNNSYQLFNLGTNIAVYFSGYNSGCTSYFLLWAWVMSPISGATSGSTQTIIAGGTNSSGISDLCGVLTQDGSLALKYCNMQTSNEYYGTYSVQRKSVIGVAQEAIATSGTGRVGTVGTYTINQSFAAGGNFDQRTATVPGTKGTVAGTSAVLFGMN